MTGALVSGCSGKGSEVVEATESSAELRPSSSPVDRAGLKLFMPTPTKADHYITLQAGDGFNGCGRPTGGATDQLVAFIDEVRPFGGLLAAFHEWDHKELWKSSMHRLAAEVIPKVRDYSRSKLARMSAVPEEVLQ